MDQKTWLWRKKSSEKITVSSDKVNLSVNKNEEEVIFFIFSQYLNYLKRSLKKNLLYDFSF